MKTKAFIYIIFAGILWGTSGLFVNYLAPYGFSSLQMTAVRGLVSFLGMAIYAFLKDKRLYKIKPSELLFFIPIGITLFSTAALYYSAMQLTSVSTAVVLMYMAPVYVMIFSIFFLGEKFSIIKIVSLVAMLVGCCFVSGIIGGLQFNLLGFILGLLSGVSYAIYNIITKIAMKRGSAPISTSLYSFLVMAMIAISISDPAKIVSISAKAPFPTIPMLVGLGIVTFVIPYFLYTLAMKDLPAGTASALGIVEPMAATVFSIIFLGEKLKMLPTVGIILIIVAVFMLGKAEGDTDNADDVNTAESENGTPS